MPLCKICCKPIKVDSLFPLFRKDVNVCHRCLEKLKPKFIKFNVDGAQALAIYNYDDELKNFIYLFKGCADIELSGIFLNRYKKELSLFYKGYTIVPVPSYYLDDEKREFNHVVEIFKNLNLPMEKLIYKSGKFKQAEHNSLIRNQVSDYLELLKIVDLKDKKILLVDDVFTTGSTMRACLKLIRSLKPKDVKILVICKTFDIN